MVWHVKEERLIGGEGCGGRRGGETERDTLGKIFPRKI